jgi:hypothetical protein
MPSMLDCSGDLANIGNTVIWRGKKMKNSAVVPHIKSRRLQVHFGDVGD